MPNNKGVRRGILNSLAISGVIPNACIKNDFYTWTDFEEMVSHEGKLNNTQGRSDMEMPWAAWKGKLNIDRNVAKKLFGKF